MTPTIPSQPDDTLIQFCTSVVADTQAQDRLAAADHAEAFTALAIALAAERGMALDAATLGVLRQPDPLGLARWTVQAVPATTWPSPAWLPIEIAAHGAELVVDWAYFGADRFDEPFFEDTVRRVLRHPLNRLLRLRMRLVDFVAGAPGDQSAPDGFIFHMSRCGSTLASQMLAAIPSNLVVSEAASIDNVIQMAASTNSDPTAVLRAMITAFARRSVGARRHCIFKLDSWHILALPLFRRAFPRTPWIFLYRDPVDVMVSQMRERGIQTIPSFVPPRLYGLADEAAANAEDYCAQVLGTICAAAARHIALGGGLLLNYRDLPAAVETRVLPHFGMRCDAAAREAMQSTARVNAKARHAPFVADSADKQRAATVAVRIAAERHIGAVYRRLESLSAAQDAAVQPASATL